MTNPDRDQRLAPSHARTGAHMTALRSIAVAHDDALAEESRSQAKHPRRCGRTATTLVVRSIVGSALPLLRYLSVHSAAVLAPPRSRRGSKRGTRWLPIAVAVVLIALPGCPEKVQEPEPGDAGMCMTHAECNPDKTCGALFSCVHGVCSREATRYIPCP